ncbi:hypothetical protein SmJEL517_g04356 [Synchytrium microbalum]|uniref:F-box/LRR-repeat protein 15-like leucin rich repeat domain-containing protein n=1 Tax=Synchytrium microbalum TaxID=1806994 RepID=A0A507BSF6_9FUNG|nr:uncharacterized protein SmJEL517_g04356 [Synchytrium microbalum]TPX32550.1 hypothetical protein SmJEL517_g04356 [Synchytrium microbalum]
MDASHPDHAMTIRDKEPAVPHNNLLLPLELLQHILHFLVLDSTNYPYKDPQLDLYSVLQTCRFWCLAATPLLYRAPNFTTLRAFDKFVNCIQAAVNSANTTDGTNNMNAQCMRSFSLHASTPKLPLFIRNYHIISIAESRPMLTTINLSNCRNLTDEAIIAIVTATCTTLVSLSLDGCCQLRDTAVSVVASFCSPWNKLSSLSLRDCPFISNTGVLFINRFLRSSLRHLDISGCKRISDTAVLSLFETTLDDDNEKVVEDVVLPVLKLQSFKCIRVPKLTRAAFLTIMDGVSALGVDDLEISVPAPPKGSPNWHFFAFPTTSLANITRLNLAKLKYLDDSKILQLSDYAHKWVELSLTELCCASDTVMVLIAHASRLKVLRLSGDAITDDVIQNLGISRCPGLLNSLDLSECENVSDAAFETWFKNTTNQCNQHPKCPNLTTINLAQCTKITSTTISLFITHCLPSSLTKLNITATAAATSFCKHTLDLASQFPSEFCKLRGIKNFKEMTYGMHERACLGLVPDVCGANGFEVVLGRDEMTCIRCLNDRVDDGTEDEGGER